MAFFNANASKYTKALWFNKDLAILTLMRTNLILVSIISTDKPFAVPASALASGASDRKVMWVQVPSPAP